MKEDEDIKLTGPAVFWICVFIIVFGVLFGGKPDLVDVLVQQVNCT